MLSSSLRILDLDGSLLRQINLLERFNPKIVDLKTVGPLSRLWLNTRTAKQITSILDFGSRQDITFLGSGDFHHLSALLIAQFQEPLSVVVFDSHPDWDVLPPHLGCGSWVSYILRQPNVKEVVIFGLSSEDISTFRIQTANLDGLNAGRIRAYPYAHKPTRVFFRSRLQNPSLRVEESFLSKIIHWQQIEGRDLNEFLPSVLEGLLTKEVYISIDKDCLKADESLTNWEEGRLSLTELTAMLSWIKARKDIVGLDITGEYSEARPYGLIKNFCSRIDHPADFSAKGKSLSQIDTANERTNIRLLETLGLLNSPLR